MDPTSSFFGCQPHPVLVLRPEAIRATPHRGTCIGETFGELAAYVSRPLVSPLKDAHGGISLGRFRDGVRRLTHFEGSTLLGLDMDAGTHDAAALFAALGPWRRFTYSTFSSTATHPKARGILVLDREVDASTHKRLVRVVYAHAARAGVALDPAAVDATRWWFAPVVHPDRVELFQVHATDDDAPPLPVAQLIRQADELAAHRAAELAEHRRRNPLPAPATSAGTAYLRAAVTKAIARVAGASAGDRHAALNVEAYSLARLGLSAAAVADALVPAFVAAAGPEREREAVRTVRDACNARGAA